MQVSVSKFCAGGDKQKLTAQAEKILKLLRVPPDTYLEIFLLDAGRMRRLNQRLRQQDRTTTILSLEAEGFTVPASRFLGEIYLCPSTIRRRGIPAKPEIKDLDTCLLYYLVHGILHLKDFDHERSLQAARQMEEKEEEIFQKIIRDFR